MAFYSYPGPPYRQQEHRFPPPLRPPMHLPVFPHALSDQPQYLPSFQPHFYDQIHSQPQLVDPDAIQAAYEAYLYQLQQDLEERDSSYYRKKPKRRRSKLHRSKSAESLNTSYSNEQSAYDAYAEELYYQNQPNHEHQTSRYHDSDSWRMKVDGEPMNELEKLAAENATINEIQSKHIDIRDNEIKTDNNDPSMDLSNLVTSLTLEEDSSCVTSNQTPSTGNNVAIVQHGKKKKSWLLKFFNKKSTPDYFLTTLQQNQSSAPPTPTLTPDNSSTSSGSSFHLIDPLLLENGIWAFQFPNSTEDDRKWYAFEQANQKIIMKYVHRFNSPRGIGCNFQLFDKRIGRGSLPVLVTPFYMKCYFATDLNLKEMITIEMRLFQNT